MSILCNQNINKLKLNIDADIVDFEQDIFKINGIECKNILKDIFFLRDGNIHCQDIIDNAFTKLADIYTISTIYDNIIDKLKDTNYHCIIMGNDHNNFIRFCFRYINSFIKPQAYI